MPGKPSYEELEQKIKMLENESGELKETIKILEKYHSLFSHINDLAYICDDKGNLLYVNKIFEKFTNHRCEDFIGKPFAPLFYDEEIEKAMNAYMAALNGEALEFTLQFKDSGVICEYNNMPRRDKKGNVIGVMGIARDITERIKTEAALQESEEKYKMLANNSMDVIWVRDMDLNTIYVSPSVEKIRGYTAEEVMAQSIDEVLTPKSVKIATNALNQFIEIIDKGELKTDSHTLELEHICKDGSTKWLEVKISLLSDSNGNLTGFIGVSRDISERRHNENEREKLQKQLQQSYKMEAIGTLTGGVAHDFNNILGIILGNTELAIDDVPEWNPAYFCLENIKDASLRAAAIVKQLLNFSRNEDHKLRPLGLVTVIKDSLNFLRSTIPTTIEMRKQLPKEEVTILADPVQINQIMMNLCVNAYQEMEETGGIIEISVKNPTAGKEDIGHYPDLTKGDVVRLTISDTGPGIDPEIVERIFDPYFTTKEVGKGSGMGLSVVHGIVKAHGGVITVASTPGKGTSFSIFFPIISRQEKPKVKPDGKVPMGQERILFVDDEQPIVDTTKQVLERLGYKVEAETNPIDALKRFQANTDRFDLVITDMTMPQMTGVKLSQKIMEIRPDTPVIICTGHSSLINREKAGEAGIAAYVMKPVRKQEIAKVIRKVIEG